MKRVSLLVWLAAVLSLAFAQAAEARFISGTASGAQASQGAVALVVTGTNAANQLNITGGPNGELILSSPGGFGSPGPPCTQDTPQQVTCPPGYVGQVRVDNLGGADVVNATPNTPASLIVNGGGGNDTVKATDEADQLNGGGGKDLLNARGGSDQVNAGGAADTLKGGDGSDLLRGGAGADKLIGGAGGDQLNGGGGRPDRCVGGGGRDLFKVGTCERGDQ